MTIDKGNLFISTPNMKKNQNTSRIEGEKKSMKHHQPKPIHQYPKNKNNCYLQFHLNDQTKTITEYINIL